MLAIGNAIGTAIGTAIGIATLSVPIPCMLYILANEWPELGGRSSLSFYLSIVHSEGAMLPPPAFPQVSGRQLVRAPCASSTVGAPHRICHRDQLTTTIDLRGAGS